MLLKPSVFKFIVSKHSCIISDNSLMCCYSFKVQARHMKGSVDMSAIKFSISERQGERGEGCLLLFLVTLGIIAFH